MTRSTASASFALLLSSALGLGLPSGASATSGRDQLDADSLYHRAVVHLAGHDADRRHLGMQELEEAARLAEKRTDILNAIARTYAAMGHSAQARHCLDRITRLAPDDAEAQLRLGLLWKWEWLASLEADSYAKAIRCLLRAALLAPKSLEPRLALTAMALANNHVPFAMLTARSAVACDPGAVESGLALACAAYRAGDLARADSAMREALPRLDAGLRRRFTDLSGVSYNARPEPLSAEAADSASISFWRGQDPDLTTPENEAQLDFLTRVAHAVLLFRDEQGVRWDMRAELFARYGIPARVELPPPPSADEDVFSYLTFFPGRTSDMVSVGFPFHLQTWVYPELGLQMELWDRSLSESYSLPVTHSYDNDPRPDPASLAERPDLVALEGGRGVYRALPPGAKFMPARAVLAQFPADSGARLVAHLEAAGVPSDTLVGTWAVVGADGREVAHGGGALSNSACDPGAERIVQFDAVVPPGDYRVDFAVQDHHGRRGLVHLESRVDDPSPGLAMSDLVLLCGAPLGVETGAPIRIEPNLDRRVTNSRTISIYFEVDHLALDSDGRSRFRYRYAVRPLGPQGQVDRSAQPALEAAREEEQVGAERRQFVTAPIPGLAPGVYDFEIEVRDLHSDAVVTRSVRLVRT